MLSADSLSRTALRSVATATLRAAGTDAGVRVYDPETMPETVAQLPALFVSAPSERKETSGTGAPQFLTTIALAVMARVSAKGAGAEAATEVALERLAAQVERVILCTPAMVSIVQRFEFVETHQVVTVQGQQPVGEAMILFGCQVWQEFWPDVGDTLTEIVTTIPASGTGAPVTLDTVLPQ